MKILVIEDEVKTAKYLSKGLTEQGFIVDIALNGLEGLYQAQEGNYDLLILDVMLPQLDGWSIVKSFRKKNQTVPILFLTAKNDVSDRVKGLHLGADDYLVKPFAFSELVARVLTLMRRGKKYEANKLTIADLTIDFESLKVMRQGQPIDLTSKEFTLLAYLMRNSGKVLSRTMIAHHVWDINFDSDTNVVDVAIRRLRSKIDEIFAKKLIQTKRGLGYVLQDD